ncbi:MAG: coproporphyrinogen III oxidase, partial [Simkania negevensis]|nr:coproporphyrinogen III oxidase [Simkania negevensis]
LPISHLSLYNLTIEPHTAFHKRRQEILKAQPKEKEAVNMLQKSCEAIEKAGLNRYEISAFAKKGRESIHNTGYWSFRPFLGLGPSAYSFYEGRRFRNIAHLKKWAQALEEKTSPIDFEEKLSYPADILERLAIGLRLFTGVDLSTFPPLPLSFPEMEKKLQKEGFLEKEGSHLFLSKKGRLFYDSVAEELISLYL